MPRTTNRSVATASPYFSAESYSSSRRHEVQKEFEGKRKRSGEKNPRYVGQPIHDTTNTLRKLLFTGGLGAAAILAPDMLTRPAEVVVESVTGDTVDLPDGMGVAYAQEYKCNTDPSSGKLICVLVGGGPTPTTQPPRPTTTTIPWERRDDDGDGVQNSSDACPQTGRSEQVDADGCSAKQRDDDGDGVIGGVEVFLGADPNNPDTDGDSKPDGVELLNPDGSIKAVLDADGDGLLDVVEPGTDIDGDGLSPETGDTDDADACKPDTKSPTCDADGDGVSNQAEIKAGTNPNSADTDGDGISDRTDKQNAPLKPGELVDVNGIAFPAPTTTKPAATTVPSTTTVPTAETEPTTTVAETVIAGDNSETGGSSNASLYIGGVLVASVTAAGGVIIMRRRREEESGEKLPAMPSKGGSGPKPGVLHRSRTKL